MFKRKTLMLVFFSMTVSTVGLASLVMKPTYEAVAQILVKIGREDVYAPALPGGASSTPIIRFDQEERINSEIEILKSQFLAQKVVASIGPGIIYSDLEDTDQGILNRLFRVLATGVKASPLQKATLKLQKDLSVEGVRKSSVIKVSFKHKDPDLAARVLNTLVSLFRDRHIELLKNLESFEFFQEQTQASKTRLKEGEAKLEAFKKKHNLSSLEEQRLLALRNEADRRTALHQTLNQEAEIKDRLQQLRAQLASTPATVLLDEENDKNPYTISGLQARLAELELKEHELADKYTDQNRLVQAVRAEIQMVRKKLAEQEDRRYQKTRMGINPVHQTLQQELFRNEAELQALMAKKESQKAQLAENRDALEKLNAIEMQFNHLRQESETYQQNYRLYLGKLEESRISNAMDAEKIANVSLLEPAHTPLKPVSPKVFLNMVLAVLLGGVGAFALAYLSEYLDASLEKPEDVENYLQLPVLASIPEHT
jgi:uncharacterized protein involved in exopolysaccharide biosynthesis